MTMAIWKAAPLALLMLLPAGPSHAGDKPTGRREKEIVIDGDHVVTLDDDGVAMLADDDDGTVIVRGDHNGRRAFLGVQLIDITPELRAHFGAPRDAGVLVAEVESDSPAAKAGLAVGDVVTRLDGERVESAADLSRAIRHRKGGDTVKIEVARAKASKTLTATVEERKGQGMEFGDLPQRFRDHDHGWAMRDFDIRIPRIGRLENIDKLQEKLQKLEKRLNDLEKKVR